MALKRLFAQRLFGKSRITNSAATNCRVSSPCTAALSKATTTSKKLASDPSDDGIFRRYFHNQSGATSGAAALRFLPTGETLLERIREMDIARSRQAAAAKKKEEEEKEEEACLTVKDAVKILKVSQLEIIKARLREIEKDQISYSEFVEICRKECSRKDEANEFAKMLDQSGSVIVIGNIVYIRPEQVVKAIQSLIPSSVSMSPRKIDDDELEEMAKAKAAIDREAKWLVQRELWCGLGCFVVQTAALMRLTFWELSWDVMEPICFFITSMQFISAYAFFLRTSIEPSFEGFFRSRFVAKQKRLMRANNFDVQRYDRLMEEKKKKAAAAASYNGSESHHAVAGFTTSPAMQ
ncbi:hypothetical protein C2S52_002338 [Perilla frutescens var. hirtella]|nr:hypothetical protein C2S52_002338 [Perilla frutescens var. hirtella]